ncbi:hypothetical protein ACLOJK_020183 [Asimina triloba]
MDGSKLLTEDGNTENQANGVLEQHTSSCAEVLALHKVNGIVDSGEETVQPDGNAESSPLLVEDEKVQSSKREVEGGPIVHEEDSRKKNHDQAKHSKLQEGQRKSSNSSVNEMPSGPKDVVATWVKKNKDGKQEKVTSPVSNGSHSKQPFAHGTNNPSSNGRQGIEHDASVDVNRPIRSSSAPSSTLNSKSRNFGSSSSATNISLSEGMKEQVKDLKPLKHGSQKTEEHAHSSPLYPYAQFYSKLEEKIQAREVEKTNQQAKCKIPTTRAKSPKLGRQKSLTTTDAEGNSSRSCRTARLSLDEKVTHSDPAKDSHKHMKKPQRKSLPKLPSERSNLLNPSDDATQQQKEQDSSSDTTTAIEQIENEAMPVANDEQSKPASDSEPVNEAASNEPINEVASSEPLAVQ